MTVDSTSRLSRRRTLTAIVAVIGSMCAVSGALRVFDYLSTVHELKSLVHLEATNDSWLFMHQAIDWLRDHPGSDVYAAVFFDQHAKFQYPLTSLLPLRMLDALGLGTHDALTRINLLVFALSCIGSALLLVSAARAAGSLAIAASRVEQTLFAVLGLLAAVCFYPLVKGFTLGQIQLWLDAAFIWACYLYLRGYPLGAGALLGFSSLIKPQMALFLVWALIRRERRFAWGWAVVFLPALALTAALYSPRQIAEYGKVLSYLAKHGESYFANQSVNGLALRWLDDPGNLLWSDTTFPAYRPAVATATFVSGLALIGFALFWRWREPRRHGFQSLVVAGICLTAASPIAWEHHYGVLLPGFLLAYAGLPAPNDRIAPGLALLVGALYILAANLWDPFNLTAATRFNFLQSYLFIAALGMVALIVFRSRAFKPTGR